VIIKLNVVQVKEPALGQRMGKAAGCCLDLVQACLR